MLSRAHILEKRGKYNPIQILNAIQLLALRDPIRTSYKLNTH